MAGVAVWPTREPGCPYRWLSDLTSDRVARTCGVHPAEVDDVGVCSLCVIAWRQALGAEDPFSWSTCSVCGMPVHPAADVGNCLCPTCEPEFIASADLVAT